VDAGEGRLLGSWNSSGSKLILENRVNLSHGDLVLACQRWRRHSEEKIDDDTLLDGWDKSTICPPVLDTDLANYAARIALSLTPSNVTAQINSKHLTYAYLGSQSDLSQGQINSTPQNI
jgi:hypothetical protein